ncbi:MAG: hypothetical protein HY293_05985 [Planctomycetes bacterium]|nr:hypothetical protein [Planctomycetota bacterium]
MRTLLVAVVAVMGFASPQGGEPINAKCPVKPNQKARNSLTVLYEGQVIGFC